MGFAICCECDRCLSLCQLPELSVMVRRRVEALGFKNFAIMEGK